jgi:hypothetical protein
MFATDKGRVISAYRGKERHTGLAFGIAEPVNSLTVPGKDFRFLL